MSENIFDCILQDFFPRQKKTFRRNFAPTHFWWKWNVKLLRLSRPRRYSQRHCRTLVQYNEPILPHCPTLIRHLCGVKISALCSQWFRRQAAHIDAITRWRTDRQTKRQTDRCKPRNLVNWVSPITSFIFGIKPNTVTGKESESLKWDSNPTTYFAVSCTNKQQF